ncbi:MAG: thiamine phosphate synthase [Deltaproteobacteria bacterium]|nr:thiamine phosphate synthase [Deltaproteobacteria bacterium]
MILPSRLYAIVDPLDTGRDPIALARAMVAGGARVLQLRLKATATGELLTASEKVREIAAAAGAIFVVNDRADVARACGADGVHLGQEDLPVAAARAVLEPGRLVGFSTHSETQLAAARASGADYLAFGPLYATTSKSAADPVLGCERLRNARTLTTTPLVAIGGITAATAPAVLAAGADAVAVIAALVRAPDVERATAELLALIER